MLDQTTDVSTPSTKTSQSSVTISQSKRALSPTQRHCRPCHRGRTHWAWMSRPAPFAGYLTCCRSRCNWHCSCRCRCPRDTLSSSPRALHTHIRLPWAADRACRSFWRALYGLAKSAASALSRASSRQVITLDARLPRHLSGERAGSALRRPALPPMAQAAEVSMRPPVWPRRGVFLFPASASLAVPWWWTARIRPRYRNLLGNSPLASLSRDADAKRSLCTGLSAIAVALNSQTTSYA